MGDSLQRELRDELAARRLRNPLYSLRAMARDLGISHSYLSLMLVGKRTPSARRHDEIRRRLAGETLPKRAPHTKDEKFSPVRPVAFGALAHWYDLALLDLTSVEGFRADPEWIARRLRVTPAKIRESMGRLKRVGLLGSDGTKSQRKISFPAKRPRRALREFHRQMITKGLDALDERAFERRDVTAITFTADPARLTKAKEKIRRFRRSLQRYLSGGRCTELYQLNVQLFPLTDPERRKS